jgi:hypothetical protein
VGNTHYVDVFPTWFLLSYSSPYVVTIYTTPSPTIALLCSCLVAASIIDGVEPAFPRAESHFRDSSVVELTLVGGSDTNGLALVVLSALFPACVDVSVVKDLEEMNIARGVVTSQATGELRQGRTLGRGGCGCGG